MPYHEKILATSDEVKKIINPQFRKEREQEEKMNVLEGEVSNIKNTLGEMMNMLSSALGQPKS
jgi:membrane protein insertase Oxa1/YidC/SpoIIIJ